MAIERKEYWRRVALVLLAIAAFYLAIPFALGPALASCSPSRAAQSVMDAYPFLGMHGDGLYKRYYYKILNDLVRHEDKNCPDENCSENAPSQ
ncbi:MAG: hypothetical protein EON58_18215 [Alphaproteobacteria bacterium]|nr:MAG: hypothetical protein EON58_18215 [Alphaproteobacteria bacterium]